MDYDKYIGVMFPYPSGNGLHMGHVYNYAIMDSYCNYLRYIGHSVFQPFGYDSFGLPAENYARKMGRDPRDVTYENITNFRKQIERMNTQYEEILVTSDTNYVQHVQWLFKELFDRGLAYKKDGNVDWCPSCETVLAKEQVKYSCCERCSTSVETKKLNQWYLKISDYTQRLIDGLDFIDYPEGTIKSQRNWLENQHDWCISRQRSWGCPIPIEGETDTLDTFVDSSLYTIIYCIMKGIKPRPVDLYIGGSEHACMHLIYVRFITMFLYDIGFIDFEEPFKKVIHQGMILKKTKHKMGDTFQKMSKSLGNVVNPDDYDPDILRFYLMFIGHYFDGGAFDDENIIGIKRFISRWKLLMDKNGSDNIDLNSFKKEIFNYTESFKFNKVVSSFMTFYNKNKNKSFDIETKKELSNLLKIYMPNIYK